jgi:hypothetical protein
LTGGGSGPAFVPVQPGDLVRLRKAHPCGGRDWQVTRIGADIGLTCATCGRRVLLTRDEFERRCVRHVPGVPAAETSGE